MIGWTDRVIAATAIGRTWIKSTGKETEKKDKEKRNS